jgi:hypothetical protein
MNNLRTEGCIINGKEKLIRCSRLHGNNIGKTGNESIRYYLK